MGNEKVYINLNQESSKNTSTESQTECGECPICGRTVSRRNSFRCKRCGREFICLMHQNPENFLCSECVNELVKIKEEPVRDATTQKTPKKKDNLSIIFFVAMLLFCCTGIFLIIKDIQQSLDYLSWRSSSKGYPFCHDPYKIMTLISLVPSIFSAVFINKRGKVALSIIGFILIGLTLTLGVISFIIYPSL